MSVFDHIDINALKNEHYQNDLERRKVKFRIDKYYEIKTKKYMDFYMGFHRFALSNSLPEREFSSTGIHGERFRGWMLTPGFGVSRNGDFYYKVIQELNDGGTVTTYYKNNNPIIFSNDGSGWCKYDGQRDVIIIKAPFQDSGYNEIAMSVPDIEYYSIVEGMIDYELRQYAEACIRYAVFESGS